MSQRLLNLVIKHAEVRGKPYHVLVQLATAANSKGEVRLTAAELRHRTRSTDDASLYSALKELQRHGYVQKWGRRHTARAYLVVNPRAINLDALLREKQVWRDRAVQEHASRGEKLPRQVPKPSPIWGIPDRLIGISFRKLR